MVRFPEKGFEAGSRRFSTDEARPIVSTVFEEGSEILENSSMDLAEGDEKQRLREKKVLSSMA